jgi:hypothetical protein
MNSFLNSPLVTTKQVSVNRGNSFQEMRGRVVTYSRPLANAQLTRFGAEQTMTRLLIGATAAILVSCASGFAQMPSDMPALEMTSPLGIGPGSPVPPARIPLGATELASPGVSPMVSATSPLSPLGTGLSSSCRGIGVSIPEASYGQSSSAATSSTGTSSSEMGSSMAGTSYGTGISGAGTTAFDGGGMAGSASGTCAEYGSSSPANPAASGSSPSGMGSVASSAGRVGIPLGSIELGAGGLSPPGSVYSVSPPLGTTTLGSVGSMVPTVGSTASGSTTASTFGSTTASTFGSSTPGSTLPTPCPQTGMFPTPGTVSRTTGQLGTC